MTTAYSAGTSPTANAQRQPSSETGTTKKPMSAARIQPRAQNDSRTTTIRPRIRVGESSLTSVEATGSSAPSPRPTRNRRRSRTASPVTSAEAPVARP
jgi:hypothetical protein